MAFAAVAAVIAALVTIALSLMSDNTLKSAAKTCDTISITAEYDAPLKLLSATQTIAYKNRANTPLNEVKFHIYANAYRDGAKNPPVTPSEIPQAYPNGKNFGGITVHSIDTDGKNTTPQIDGDDDTVLIVPLAEPLKTGAVARIAFDYTVTLANIRHRLGWTDDAVNLANFYPVPCIYEGGTSSGHGGWQCYPYSPSGDPFYNALHNFDVRLTAPQNMAIASSGTLMKSTQKDGKKTVVLKSTAIRDFAAVLSPKFKNVNRSVGKTTVKYYYLDDDAPQKSLDTSVKALKTFSKLFTKYPYKQLSIVQTDFLHGGMEYGELVYISRQFLNPAAAGVSDPSKKPDREGHDYVIVHEIAHQWWYGIVGNNQSRTAWIDEGLAEYSTLLFYDHNPEYNIDRKTIIENARANYSAYIKIIKGVGGELNTNMDRDLSDFNNPFEYVYMTYVRGLLLFCDLESILTKPSLVKALSDFSKATKFSIATQAKLVDAIEKSTNAKVGLFFDSYLSGL